MGDTKTKYDVMRAKKIITEHHGSFWNIPLAPMTMLQEGEVGRGNFKID